MKKDETRFTIRFNPVDPRQLRAMNALEAAGRRKSTLIADAVCEYLERSGERSEAYSLPIITAPVMASNPRSETLPQKEEARSQATDISANYEKNDENPDMASDANSDDADFEDEINRAILDGLAAFDL